MKYTYEVFKFVSEGNTLTHQLVGTITTNLDDINDSDVTPPFYVRVTDLVTNKTTILESPDDLLGFRTGYERGNAWKHNPYLQENSASLLEDLKRIAAAEKQALADKIDPKHYQDFMEGFQWIEAMSRIPRYKNNPEAFKGAIELQIRKYLDRNGKKDNELQELKKALWYMKFYVAYVQEGCTPIFVNDIEKILNRK
jgi:hypothetical protein